MPDISVLNLDGTDRNVKDAGISSWARASTKPSYTASEVGAIASSLKGAANGVAELDSTGKVPSSQLPSYVDDVLEYNSLSAFPSTGETGKIYVAKDTNKTYRWSGTAYVVISETLALGETSSTAYYGDKGKTAYDHSQSTHARTDATKTEASSTNGNIKINGTETTVYRHPGTNTSPHEYVAGIKSGISSNQYGYYNANNTFVPFKSQADIDAAVAAAKVGNAAAGDVLSGKTFTNSSTSGVTGSMTNNGAVSPSGLNCGGSYTIPAGYHNGSGKVTANSLASQTGVDSGKTAVTSGAMLSGYQGWVNGSKVSGNISSKGTATYNTSTSDQTISSGQYLSGTQTIKAVTTSGISAANIKDGTTIKVGDANNATRIKNVTGTFTSSSTVSSGQTAASAEQILSGYSAWVNGAEVQGNYEPSASGPGRVKYHCHPCYQINSYDKYWRKFTWSSGITSVNPDYIWTDGDNIYYSNSTTQKVLNKTTNAWVDKSWNYDDGCGAAARGYGNSIWTDGENIYYSRIDEYNNTQCVLNKSTGRWSKKTWNGLTPQYGGLYIWTDGTNIYYSNGSDQYVLNKATSTWSAKTWNGLTSFGGHQIWTDGENIYYSSPSGPKQYVLNKATSTWSAKTWNGFNSLDGRYVWSDGENMYYSDGSTNQYILDKATSTWNTKTWSGGLTSFFGEYVWTDGDDIHYSQGGEYILGEYNYYL